jgi:hypothetical protein
MGKKKPTFPDEEALQKAALAYAREHTKERALEFEKVVVEYAAYQHHLQHARELLKRAGFVQGPGDIWTPASMGKRGGKVRAKNLTRGELTEIGRKGAQTRWAKKLKKGSRS